MAHSTKKLGMMFTVGAWVLAFLIMALGFSKILDRQNNPNQSVSTLQGDGFQEVVLTRSRYSKAKSTVARLLSWSIPAPPPPPYPAGYSAVSGSRPAPGPRYRPPMA
jgi:hypothetical protein